MKLILTLFIFFLLTSPVSAREAHVSNVDFIHFLQLEIGNCVKNMKKITGQSNKHAIFLNECTRVVVDANKLGKIEFSYRLQEDNNIKRVVEECSQYLQSKDFFNCIYE